LSGSSSHPWPIAELICGPVQIMMDIVRIFSCLWARISLPSILRNFCRLADRFAYCRLLRSAQVQKNKCAKSGSILAAFPKRRVATASAEYHVLAADRTCRAGLGWLLGRAHVFVGCSLKLGPVHNSLVGLLGEGHFLGCRSSHTCVQTHATRIGVIFHVCAAAASCRCSICHSLRIIIRTILLRK